MNINEKNADNAILFAGCHNPTELARLHATGTEQKSESCARITSTITSFNVMIPVTYKACPHHMTAETCPLRKHLNQFHDTIFARFNDVLYVNKSTDWNEIRDHIAKLSAVCVNCQNKQKTR
ncbi:MAG: hypothetical protein ACLRFJ_01825 [Alphaproteobacteria bacterium]